MPTQTIPDYIDALLDPRSYPHPADHIRHIQTHISHVLIAGDYVYKYKKPVNFGFLDFSTLEKRGHYCLQELTLNSRLCPDIYLNRVSVNRSAQGFSLDGDGELIEYGVKMKRMDERRMMGRVIEAGGLQKRHLDAVVDTLVPFYAGAEADAEIRAYGRPEAVALNVLENFDQTETFVGGPALSRGQFDRISGYAKGVLEQQDRFLKRIEDERIRDCHGDLYSANICLDEPVHIFDCIEFNDRFRYSDVAADIGFLAMDLDYHGLEAMAEYVVEHFARQSEDSGLLDLIDFYKCYRAYVRAKINLFTAADDGLDQETAAQCMEQAGRYFELADRYAVNDA